MGVTYASRYRALDLVARKVEQVDVVLDLGPGIRPQAFIKPYVHICVDAHRPYLERIKQRLSGDPKYVLINATWDQVTAMLPDKSVDTVFALDFIEHLEKPDGLRMLREAERVARRQVVVHTPHGFFPQSYEDPSKPDRWGLDGGYWQTHRSGWSFEDFGELWDIVCCRDYVLFDENDRPMDQPMGAIWAFRNLRAEPDRSHPTPEAPSVLGRFRTILEQGLPPVAFRGLRSAWLALLRARHRVRAKR
jgi:hypothetical protein